MDASVLSAGRLPAERPLRARAEACWACGDPGLQFETQINSWHTCPAPGQIVASNPCGELLHLSDSACDLASLNLLRFLGRNGYDLDGYVHAVEVMLLAQQRFELELRNKGSPRLKKAAEPVFLESGVAHASPAPHR